MAVWSQGYFTDAPYTAKAYPEMAPGALAFACLRQGLRPPRLGQSTTYLELGCGQGFGLNLLAAANPHMAFWGVDFLPGQIANAARLAADAGLTNVRFEDLSFEQLLAEPPKDLPRCDVVALHGVYSWVSRENQAHIVRILDRFLKPGGLAYVSYNCLPGWTALAPLQKFVAGYVAQAPGDPGRLVLEALRAAQQMVDVQGGFFASIPMLKPRIEEALREDPAYLMHEYLNACAAPLYHADVARDLAGARLEFAASANVADDILHLAAPAPLQAAVQAARDPVWRETLLDYAGMKPFRRDIFLRGRNPLSAMDRDRLLDQTVFALMTPTSVVVTEFPVPIGLMKGQPSLYRPLIDALSTGPRTFGDLRALPELAGAREGGLLQAVSILVGGRQLHPVPETTPERAAAVRLNRAIVRRALEGETLGHVAAALPGAPLRVDFSDLMAMHAAFEGDEDAAHTATQGWAVMARTGRRLIRDGQTLPDQAANEAELANRIAAFRREKLPLFQTLGSV